MFKRMMTLFACLAIPLTSVAQEPDRPLPSDRLDVFHQYLRFADYLDGGEVAPRWMSDGDRFWYEVPEVDGGGYRLVDSATGQTSELFDEDRLRDALLEATGELFGNEGLPFGGFVFSASGSDVVSFTLDSIGYELDLADYSIREAPPAQDPGPRPRRIPHYTGMPMYMVEALSPDGLWFAGIEGGNITLRSTETDSVVFLTADGSEAQPWGASDWELGLYWTADSKRLLASRLQSAMQAQWPFINYPSYQEAAKGVAPTVTWQPASYYSQPQWGYDLYLFDVESGDRTKLEFEDDRGQSFVTVRWIPDDSGFLVKRQTFRGKAMELLVVDPGDGSYRTLLHESVDRGSVYAPNEPMYWTFLEDGRRFVLRSERDGWQHLYLYDVHDGLIRRLTQGPTPIRDSDVDEANGWVYFELHNVDSDRPWDRQIGRVPLDGGEMEILTTEPGQHRLSLSPSGRYFVDVHASMERPLRTDLRTADGSLIMTLAEGSVSRAREELSWRPPDSFVALAADGTTKLHGTLYKPWDFDPGLRYAIIDGGGTHGMGGVSLRRDLAARSMHPRQALAQLGFIVVSFDERGQFWRGRDFRLSTWGRGEIDQAADHRAVLQQLAAERPWMDLDRVGVIGHSTGGFRATRLMLLAPDLYDVGVSAAGPDLPREAQDSYWHEISGSDEMPFIPNSVLAQNLAGRLLLIAGTEDRQGPMISMMPLIDALVQAGKQYDLVLIPGAGHGMFFPGIPYSDYFWDTVARYFMDHLGRPERRN